ncbi:Rpb7-binding protein seb1 [Colletotrichum orbiculare MAFF 240422]|uniref:Rpb7-binding protein seb1 n=1 Tax=Colletotrichum orbiculare (strain 104-T / ATCC 96160 / CBS 514.97 / LARS 414 / MAFF 240422) TaxID=1213857 RepID=A0A484G519_COLOR|nr:Rpb7-binding protein seb1 [Colletotrichum orbiculare MAFF 240422]
MATAVAELEAGLQAMLGLKPPGVTTNRINGLTKLCLDNVQSESVLVQKLYTHFKKAPMSHKLGVLYVVDSVTRKWLEQAKSRGQHVDGSAPDGTYAAGVHRVSELMPVLMNDMLQSPPEGQKDKISKLLEIWEKGQTFSRAMIESFRQKLKDAHERVESTTPAGSPPPGLVEFMGYNSYKPAAPAQPPAPSTQDTSAIMAALANISRNAAAPTQPKVQIPIQPAAQPPAQDPAHSNALSVLANLKNIAAQHQPAYSTPPVPQPTTTPAALPFTLFQPPPTQGLNQPAGNPYLAVPGLNDPAQQQQFLLFKTLVDQGISMDKIPALLAALNTTQPGNFPPASLAPSATSATPITVIDHPIDIVVALDLGLLVAAGRPAVRLVVAAIAAPTLVVSLPVTDNVKSESPPARQTSGEKWIDFDRSLGPGKIKVLSRTLFVGGVNIPEREVREFFGRYGPVQTCIVNKEKHHAFVKMITRQDAIRAKEARESVSDSDGSLRTRWGVGFGPRDCSDYSTGISIIPISRLTEADRKWLLTAEYGGTGGRPIETGIVVEEPDIEIGAGVSSKAISRRMQTDKSGNHGPRSTRDNERDDQGRWNRGRERRDDQASGANAQPLPQQFPFGISAGPNGMPQFPPGFSFPAPNGQ